MMRLIAEPSRTKNILINLNFVINKGEMIGIIGPSGVGKGFVKKAILTAFPGRLIEPIVVTTRPKRSDDGPDRLAGISEEEFE